MRDLKPSSKVPTRLLVRIMIPVLRLVCEVDVRKEAEGLTVVILQRA